MLARIDKSHYIYRTLNVSENMNWYDFTCIGKKPAKLECVRWFSGLSIGRVYTCWHDDGKFYHIFNDNDRSVKIAKVCFKVIDKGDI